MYNSIARNNYVHNEGIAIFVSRSHNNEIYNNTISDSTNAIYVRYHSSNNSIHDNTMINSTNGIHADGTGAGNAFYSNKISHAIQIATNVADSKTTNNNPSKDIKIIHSPPSSSPSLQNYS
jgi:parallel beta-helix repeat protein